MILSASRRTDIPAYYSEWFFNRLKAGHVLVRNPMNPHRISKISLSPKDVDGIVFWTKNPAPMLSRLEGLRDFPFYFQFTLNAYGKDAEPNVPSKGGSLVPAFRELSRRIGKGRIVWRYDPVFFNEKYTPEYHMEYFDRLANLLAGCTETCTVSFLDFYRHLGKKLAFLGTGEPSAERKLRLMRHFSQTAADCGMTLRACAEDTDFSRFGVLPAHCIDKSRLERLCGCRLDLGKDRNQRPACGCCESVDIGAYDTCPNGCLYCYANRSARAVRGNAARYDPSSPLLCGRVGENDVVSVREVRSCRNGQLTF